jgi:hypothetical protein
LDVSTSLRAAALLLLAGLTLTACGTSEAAPKPTVTFTNLGAPKPTPAATPSPTSTRKFQADGGYYVNVYDLHHEVVAAGNKVCKDNHEYWGAVAFADGTISCAKQAIMLNVFPSPEALEKNKAKEIEIGNVQSYDFTTEWLQGKNWTIRAPKEDMAALQKKLGGQIVSFSYGPSHRK